MNAVHPEDILTRRAALPEAVVRYADHADGVIDVHLPDGVTTGAPHPLVVLVHGGFWRQAYDRVHVRPMARALVAQGYVVAAVEYRRVGGDGGWPTTAEDVEAAVTALPELLEGLGVATSTTSLVGHSAGGHLVLWLAARSTPAARSSPVARSTPAARVVPLAPVADLRTAAHEGLGDGATQDLLGGEPDAVPDRYAAADPLTLLDDDTAPAGRIVVVHGTDDDVVPVTQSRALVARHPGVELRALPGLGHFEVIDPGSAAWPVVLDAIDASRAPAR